MYISHLYIKTKGFMGLLNPFPFKNKTTKKNRKFVPIRKILNKKDTTLL